MKFPSKASRVISTFLLGIFCFSSVVTPSDAPIIASFFEHSITPSLNRPKAAMAGDIRSELRERLGLPEFPTAGKVSTSEPRLIIDDLLKQSTPRSELRSRRSDRSKRTEAQTPRIRQAVGQHQPNRKIVTNRQALWIGIPLFIVMVLGIGNWIRARYFGKESTASQSLIAPKIANGWPSTHAIPKVFPYQSVPFQTPATGHGNGPPELEQVTMSESPEIKNKLEQFKSYFAQAMDVMTKQNMKVDLRSVRDFAKTINPNFTTRLTDQQLAHAWQAESLQFLLELNQQIFLPSGEFVDFDYSSNGIAQWKVAEGSWKSNLYLGSVIWESEGQWMMQSERTKANDASADGRFMLLDSKAIEGKAKAEYNDLMSNPAFATSSLPLPHEIRSLILKTPISEEEYVQLYKALVYQHEKQHTKDYAFAELWYGEDLRNDVARDFKLVESILKPDSFLRGGEWPRNTSWSVDNLFQAVPIKEFSGPLVGTITVMDQYFASGKPEDAYLAFLYLLRDMNSYLVHLQRAPNLSDMMKSYYQAGTYFLKSLIRTKWYRAIDTGSGVIEWSDVLQRLEKEGGAWEKAKSARDVLQEIYEMHFWSDSDRQYFLTHRGSQPDPANRSELRGGRSTSKRQRKQNENRQTGKIGLQTSEKQLITRRTSFRWIAGGIAGAIGGGFLLKRIFEFSRFKSGYFYVVFQAHSTEEDLNQIQPILNEIIKHTHRDQNRNNNPELFVIREYLLPAQDIYAQLPPWFLRRVSWPIEAFTNPIHKPVLKAAYDRTVQMEKEFYAADDYAPNDARYKIRSLLFQRNPNENRFASALTLWNGKNGVRERRTELDFETWYDIIAGWQLNHKADKALVEGRMDDFFREYQAIEKLLSRTKSLRDQMARQQALDILRANSNANVVYVVGFNHRSNRDLLMEGIEKGNVYDLQSDLTQPIDAEETLGSHYKNGIPMTKQEERDLLAKSFLLGAFSRSQPNDWTSARLTQETQKIFRTIEEKGLRPSEVLEKLGEALRKQTASSQPIAFQRRAIVNLLHQFGWMSDDVFNQLSRSELRGQGLQVPGRVPKTDVFNREVNLSEPSALKSELRELNVKHLTGKWKKRFETVARVILAVLLLSSITGTPGCGTQLIDAIWGNAHVADLESFPEELLLQLMNESQVPYPEFIETDRDAPEFIGIIPEVRTRFKTALDRLKVESPRWYQYVLQHLRLIKFSLVPNSFFTLFGELNVDQLYFLSQDFLSDPDSLKTILVHESGHGDPDQAAWVEEQMSRLASILGSQILENQAVRRALMEFHSDVQEARVAFDVAFQQFRDLTPESRMAMAVIAYEDTIDQAFFELTRLGEGAHYDIRRVLGGGFQSGETQFIDSFTRFNATHSPFHIFGSSQWIRLNLASKLFHINTLEQTADGNRIHTRQIPL
ncbi:MAG: hypothetical protein HY582_03285, partial [Candidatus Omnitrophica bacterium]|nr:hypothetical protein [Candidatus Omnitrophota bacterium]